MDDVVASTTKARSTSGLSVRALFVALRPRQWPKNGLVFIALAFTLNIQDVNLLLKSVATFVCFCALSSAGYLLNDVVDIEADRAHPTKRLRPIAAGQVPVQVALALGIALALLGLVTTFLISFPLGLLAVTYAVLTARLQHDAEARRPAGHLRHRRRLRPARGRGRGRHRRADLAVAVHRHAARRAADRSRQAAHRVGDARARGGGWPSTQPAVVQHRIHRPADPGDQQRGA